MSPEAPVPQHSPPTTPSNAPRQRRHTILIVDDEVDVQESLRHLFHRSYKVITAGSGDKALEALRDHEVHLILSDQRMPGMTGDVFLGHARRIQPDAIRMLCTGYADIQAVISAVNEGYIFRYILKPWDVAELEGIIRQAAEQHDLIADRKRLIVELQQANARLLKINEELARVGKLKSAFIEVASHEFNTPITLVLGLSELLRLMNPDRDEQERAIVERISASAKQLAKLVAGTLTLMRADDFRRTFRRAPVDLELLLKRVASKVEPFVHARRQRLDVAIDEGLGTFQIDADKIDACILNLLMNAVKFTPDEGQLRLSARLVESDEAEIKVEDHGAGIDAASLEHLFQPFFTQFDPSRHSSGDFGFNKRGLGVGLSIVRQFIEMHGGTVRAESEPGAGATFTIRLPRTGPNPDTESGSNSEAPNESPPSERL